MNNYIYHGSQGLIALPERNVQTFPSGLVRIDRVYACRKTLVDRFRRDLTVGNSLPFDDGAPAIDGAFIFPDPQEVVRDDGFAEFRVSAYGRTNTTGNIDRQGQFERLDVFNFLYENYIFTKVLPSNVSLSQIFEPPQIEPVAEFQKSANVLSIIEYNGPVRLRESGPGFATSVSYVITANQKALVVESLSEFSNNTVYSLYRLDKGINYISHTTQNFGAFSEYSIAYSPNIPFILAAAIRNFLPV
jgi:hypothetical protein